MTIPQSDAALAAVPDRFDLSAGAPGAYEIGRAHV